MARSVRKQRQSSLRIEAFALSSTVTARIAKPPDQSMYREDGPADILAEGDRGQAVHISATNGVIVVRNGTSFGIPLDEWTDALYQVAADL